MACEAAAHGLRYTLVDQTDICRSARLLIEGLGADRGMVHASQTADQMLARGDVDGKLVQLTILQAIEELQRTERRSDESVN